MTLPQPRAGLVVNYSYLWASERSLGVDEGRKDRPCAIVAAVQKVEGHDFVTVVPITHTPPRNPADAVEIPAVTKARLGLDAQRSWIILTETNDFTWPGVDLRPIPGQAERRFDHGLLPPKLFQQVKQGVLQHYTERKLARVERDEKREEWRTNRRERGPRDRGGRDR